MSNTKYSMYFTCDEARQYLATLCSDTARDYANMWLEALSAGERAANHANLAEQKRWTDAAECVLCSATQAEINAVIDGSMEICGEVLHGEVVEAYLKDNGMIYSTTPKRKVAFNFFSPVGLVAYPAVR